MGVAAKMGRTTWCPLAGDDGHTATPVGFSFSQTEELEMNPKKTGSRKVSKDQRKAEIAEGISTADIRTKSEQRQAWDRSRYHFSGRKVELLFAEFPVRDLEMVVMKLSKMIRRKKLRLSALTQQDKEMMFVHR